MSQGYEVCLRLIHSKKQLRSRAGKYWREKKTWGEKGESEQRDVKKQNTTEEIKNR